MVLTSGRGWYERCRGLLPLCQGELIGSIRLQAHVQYNPIALAEQTAAKRNPKKAKDEGAETTESVKASLTASQAGQAASSGTQAQVLSPSKRKAAELADDTPVVDEGTIEIEGDGLGEGEWEEVIQGGKVMKVRKVEVAP